MSFPSEVPPATIAFAEAEAPRLVAEFLAAGWEPAAIRRTILASMRRTLTAADFGERGAEVVMAVWQRALDAALGPP